MRIQITLNHSEEGKNYGIPKYYQPFLYNYICQLMADVSEKHVSQLHHQLPSTEGSFHLFTFSHLFLEKLDENNGKILSNSDFIEWQIASPVEQFINDLIVRIFDNRQISIPGMTLFIESVEPLPAISFSSSMEFYCISPIVVSKDNTQMHWSHPNFYNTLHDDLLEKFRQVNGQLPFDQNISIEIDKEYIQWKCGRVSTLLYFRNQCLKAVTVPFRATGSTDLIKMAYDCGLGHHNHWGLGMIDTTEL